MQFIVYIYFFDKLSDFSLDWLQPLSCAPFVVCAELQFTCCMLLYLMVSGGELALDCDAIWCTLAAAAALGWEWSSCESVATRAKSRNNFQSADDRLLMQLRELLPGYVVKKKEREKESWNELFFLNRFFSSLLFQANSFNRRQHRKYCVVNGIELNSERERSCRSGCVMRKVADSLDGKFLKFSSRIHWHYRASSRSIYDERSRVCVQ